MRRYGTWLWKWRLPLLATFSAGAIIGLGACEVMRGEPQPPTPTAPAQAIPGTGPLKIQRVTFNDLPGWPDDDLRGAMQAFRNSCSYFARNPDGWDKSGIGGRLEDWLSACRLAKGVPDNRARAFLETHFLPYRISQEHPGQGKLTSYATPLVRGRKPPCKPHETPLHSDPGPAKRNLPRKHISRGALKGHELVCIGDAVDAYEAMIQGSTFVQLRDNTILPIRPVANNGHDYVSLNKWRATIKQLRLLNPEVPEAARLIMELNPRYVYYRVSDTSDVLGSINVPLTAKRSLAVDPNHTPYGIPVWLDAGPAALRRLVFAQDTGNAIKGVGRGDFFAGTGMEAMRRARTVNTPVNFYVLLPKEGHPVPYEPVATKQPPQTITPAPATPAYHAIQLGLFSTRDGANAHARNLWPSLGAQAAYNLRIIEEAGPRFRVLVTGFPSAEAARSFCQDLKGQGAACFYRRL